MANEETHIQAAIRAALDKEGIARMFRSNTGQAYTTRLPFAELKKRVPDVGIIKFGLSIGSSDLIGLTKDDGFFCGCEVKTPKGKMSPAQITFLQTINKYGGIAIEAKSPEEAIEKIVAAIKAKRA